MIINSFIICEFISILAAALEYNPTAKAELVNSNDAPLVDIEVLNASLLQCNVLCVTKSNCDAFTIQKPMNNSAKDESNVCKLQRNKNLSDSDDQTSIPQDGDITLVVKRGPIYESKQITRRFTYLTNGTPTTVTTVPSTTTAVPPDPIPMPKYGSYICSAIDELDADRYIFFWSGLSSVPPMFTVVSKNDISGTRLQDSEVGKVFLAFDGNLISSAFTVNNITYILTDNRWVKYRIVRNAEGLIAYATKLEGGISNVNLQKDVYATTVIGNDSVLWRQLDSKVFCFHVAVIDDNQITQPPPSTLCQQAADYMLHHVNATSVLGHSATSLRFLYNFKLYPYIEN